MEEELGDLPRCLYAVSRVLRAFSVTPIALIGQLGAFRAGKHVTTRSNESLHTLASSSL